MNRHRPRTVRLRVGLDDRCDDRAQRDRPALVHRHRLALGLGQRLARLLFDLIFDALDDLLGILLAAVDEQPAWALRHVAAHEQHGQADHGAEHERQAPAEVRREDVRVQRQHRQQRATDAAEPVAAVDRDVHAPAVVLRDQLVDRRVDRGVLAADPHPRDEAHDEEPAREERDRRQQHAAEVDDQRDHEQLLAPQAVGQLAEHERTRRRHPRYTTTPPNPRRRRPRCPRPHLVRRCGWRSRRPR